MRPAVYAAPFAAAVAIAALAAAPASAQSSDARVKIAKSGDWEWHEQDGRRVARIFPGDGATFTVMCPSPGGRPGVIAATAAGQPVAGQVSVTIDGGKTRRFCFKGNSFVADTPNKAKRFGRMVERLRAGSTLRLEWGAGGGMELSLDGSSAAIGPCR